MPGANARALEKSRGLGADALIFDLEDAVAPDAKSEARTQVAATLGQGGYGARELIVRVNGLDTPWGADDIAALRDAPPDAVLFPKLESAEMTRSAAAALEAAGLPCGTAIWGMIETPLGVLHAEQIAAASPRLAVLVMGTSDLAKDLHCLHTPSRLPVMTSLAWCILTARAYGLGILDGVHLDLADEAGFEAACRQGREMGFDGKTLIHPKTLAAANAAFGPDAAEIDWSERVIEAHESAERDGKGVVLVDGKLLENLHVEEARRTVELAGMIEALGESPST